MAPPSKADKSPETLKTYALTKEVRRNLDTFDRSPEDRKTMELSEALAMARKLERYLAQTLENRLTLAGNGQAVYNANWQTT